jgi:SanA protein
MKIIKKICFIFCFLVGIFFILTLGINIYMSAYADKYIISSFNDLPEPKGSQGWTCLVLGAQVSGTTLSPVLKDRVEAGANAFLNNYAQNLLLSGDHGKKWYDEVNAMRVYIIDNYAFFDKNRIFLDHAGFDTYDSIRRAQKIFCAENLIIISQDFHTTRAVYIARKLGINAYAYAVDQSKYSKKRQFAWAFREYFARIKAFFDTMIRRDPQYLGSKIPITGSGLSTWDMSK